MDTKNIQSLMESLVRLGFSPAVEHQLLYHICLRQKEFAVRERKAFGADIVSYSIACKIKENGTKWTCTYFDAILRKEIGTEPHLLNGTDVAKVEERMRGINWQELAYVGSAPVIQTEDKKTWEAPVLADEVMGDLEALSITPEGRDVADILRYKYWVDTPLDRLIPNLSVLKTRLELSQRFYVLGKDSITADEAFRFLNNRWIQRQIQNGKKEKSVLEQKVAGHRKADTAKIRKKTSAKGNG
ncbi:MAG: hypothetical protein INR73_26955 [Williamsia sp.]|nr:hypothetical protein [Williamsia sp.]